MCQSTKYLAVYADEESSHLKALALLQNYLGSLQNTKVWWVQIQHNVCCYHFSSDSSPKFISWLRKTHPRPDPLADFSLSHRLMVQIAYCYCSRVQHNIVTIQ